MHFKYNLKELKTKTTYVACGKRLVCMGACVVVLYNMLMMSFSEELCPPVWCYIVFVLASLLQLWFSFPLISQ